MYMFISVTEKFPWAYMENPQTYNIHIYFIEEKLFFLVFSFSILALFPFDVWIMFSDLLLVLEAKFNLIYLINLFFFFCKFEFNEIHCET